LFLEKIMVPVIQTSQASQYIGKIVQIRGHLQSLRNLGQIAFLTVRDGRATLQMVAEDQALLARLRQLQMETPCLFTGLIKAREHNKPKAKAKAKAEEEAEEEAEAKSETPSQGTLTEVVQPEP
jgi:aspartyl/asparaginyl-tRNA synthetase